MNNLAQILLGLFIAALVTVLAAPYFIDWNQYKSEIEAQASKLIGHQLTVVGDVHLRLLPAPYLQLENISVDAAPNPANGGEPIPSLLEAHAFRLWAIGTAFAARCHRSSRNRHCQTTSALCHGCQRQQQLGPKTIVRTCPALQAQPPFPYNP